MICKNTKANAYYFVSKVKKQQINGQTVTKCMIRDYIKGMTKRYLRYYLTIWEDIDIQDGDTIQLLDFDGVIASYDPTAKQINMFMSAIVKKIDVSDNPPVNVPYDQESEE